MLRAGLFCHEDEGARGTGTGEDATAADVTHTLAGLRQMPHLTRRQRLVKEPTPDHKVRQLPRITIRV